MRSSKHRAVVYYGLEDLLAVYVGFEEHARKMWKRHREKHGEVPLISKCPICSGREYKKLIKTGKFNEHRPTKSERDEIFDDEE